MCCPVLYRAVLCYSMMFRVVLCCSVLLNLCCTILYCAVMCCVILRCAVLRCAMLCCAVLHYTSLDCIVLYYAALPLHSTIQYCAVQCILAFGQSFVTQKCVGKCTRLNPNMQIDFIKMVQTSSYNIRHHAHHNSSVLNYDVYLFTTPTVLLTY